VWLLQLNFRLMSPDGTAALGTDFGHGAAAVVQKTGSMPESAAGEHDVFHPDT
jgi:hypothetical protein